MLTIDFDKIETVDDVVLVFRLIDLQVILNANDVEITEERKQLMEKVKHFLIEI